MCKEGVGFISLVKEISFFKFDNKRKITSINKYNSRFHIKKHQATLKRSPGIMLILSVKSGI
jgi:hypothetical protein